MRLTKALVLGFWGLAGLTWLPACDDEAGAEPTGASSGGLNGALTGATAGTSGTTASTTATSAGTTAGTGSSSTAGSAGTTATAGTSGGLDAGLDDGGSDGSSDATAGEGGSDAEAGASVSGIDTAELEMLRELCLDTINDHRATIGMGPLDRAMPAQELCSDEGSKQDADQDAPHSSANVGNPCYEPGTGFPNFGRQNTCPGYTVGGFGSPTVADALTRCLQQMWDEGEPSEGREKCEADFNNQMPQCFLAHGHYLNMTTPGTKAVSCGFYRMADGRYWMNQDFI